VLLPEPTPHHARIRLQDIKRYVIEDRNVLDAPLIGLADMRINDRSFAVHALIVPGVAINRYQSRGTAVKASLRYLSESTDA